MAENSLVADLVEIVRQAGKVPATKVVGPETRFVDDLGIDSLDLVAVFLSVQDRYGVEIDDDDVVAMKTIGDVAGYVLARGGQAAA